MNNGNLACEFNISFFLGIALLTDFCPSDTKTLMKAGVEGKFVVWETAMDGSLGVEKTRWELGWDICFFCC
jgi:hypothetical protein